MNHYITVDWNIFLCEVCEYALTNNSAKTDGVNTTFEINESCFSKRKYNRRRLLPNQWVLGGICRKFAEFCKFS
jgi:hypothetical protein